jgi:streptogramin lyase
MFETFRSSHRAAKNTKKTNVRLHLEELEGRCLLSSGFGPLGGITTGPDGDIWFLEKDRLGRIDPHSGLIQEFAQGINTGINPNRAGSSIAEAPDGSIWFLSNGQVTRFSPSTNALDTFNLSAGFSALDDLTIGPDGVVWVFERRLQDFAIARIDPTTRSVQDYGVGQISPMPLMGFGFGPDGKIWIATFMYPTQEMDPATGVVQAGNGYTGPPKIAADGSYWFFVWGGPGWCAGCAGINEYYPSTGLQKQFALGMVAALQLTPGPDGNIWYTYASGRLPGGALACYVGMLNPTTGAFESFSTATQSQAPPPSTGSTRATGTTLSATAGFDILSAVATFTPQAPIASPGQAYQATIQWGDGTTSSIVLTVTASGTYDIVGEHTYQTAGTYTIKVTIGNFDPANPLGDNPITVFSTANVDPFNMNMY